MNQYGGLDALMALSQMSPEQFQTGLDRMSQIQQRYTPQTQQPTMTQTNDAEGGFGTGANPYTQPYYQRQFGQGYQAPGYYGRSFMPMTGGLYGQTRNPYSMGKGGAMPSYGTGKGGYF